MSLKREITLFEGTMISLTTIIGGGVYVLYGATIVYAGNLVFLSALLAGVVVFAVSLSYVDLSIYVKREFINYSGPRSVLGTRAAILSGGCWILMAIAGGAMMLRGFGIFLSRFLPVPPEATALVTGAVLLALNLGGVKTLGRLISLMTLVKVLPLVVLVAMLLPLFSINGFNSLPQGDASGFMVATGMFIFSLAGFGRAAQLNEEFRDIRDVPRAVFLSIFISVLLYLMIGLVVVGSGRWNGTSSVTALAEVLGQYEWIIYLGGMFSTVATALSDVLGISRAIRVLSQDNILPRWFAQINERGVPARAVFLAGILMEIATLVNIVVIAEAVTVYLAVTYIIMCISGIKYRRSKGKRSWPLIVGMIGIVSVVPFFEREALILGGAGIVIIGLLALLYHDSSEKRKSRE